MQINEFLNVSGDVNASGNVCDGAGNCLDSAGGGADSFADAAFIDDGNNIRTNTSVRNGHLNTSDITLNGDLYSIGKNMLIYRQDDSTFTVYIGSGPGVGNDLIFRWRPEQNGSDEIDLRVMSMEDSRQGLRLNADQDIDKLFAPLQNNAYDLGHSSYCWEDFYRDREYDCSSPTKSIRGKKAMPLVRGLAKAHLKAGEVGGSSGSPSSSSAAAEIYHSLVPLEFQGPHSNCGWNVTDVDEVLNALVLGVDELDYALSERGYCTSDEGPLEARIIALEGRVDDLEDALLALFGTLTAAGVIGGGTILLKRKPGNE